MRNKRAAQAAREACAAMDAGMQGSVDGVVTDPRLPVGKKGSVAV